MEESRPFTHTFTTASRGVPPLVAGTRLLTLFIMRHGSSTCKHSLTASTSRADSEAAPASLTPLLIVLNSLTRHGKIANTLETPGVPRWDTAAPACSTPSLPGLHPIYLQARCHLGTLAMGGRWQQGPSVLCAGSLSQTQGAGVQGSDDECQGHIQQPDVTGELHREGMGSHHAPAPARY